MVSPASEHTAHLPPRNTEMVSQCKVKDSTLFSQEILEYFSKKMGLGR